LEDLCTNIQSLNAEAASTLDPLEQQEKFDKIQQANNELNTLYEAQTISKNKLCNFLLVVQTTYLQMHQVDAIVDYEWNSLVASKPKECITDATQQFVVESLLLSRKWQEKVDNFQEVRKISLELVPKLGSSFEKEKPETTEGRSESNTKPKGKKEQQSNLEATEKMKT
jgi:hypothetical protein